MAKFEKTQTYHKIMIAYAICSLIPILILGFIALNFSIPKNTAISENALMVLALSTVLVSLLGLVWGIKNVKKTVNSANKADRYAQEVAHRQNVIQQYKGKMASIQMTLQNHKELIQKYKFEREIRWAKLIMAGVFDGQIELFNQSFLKMTLAKQVRSSIEHRIKFCLILLEIENLDTITKIKGPQIAQKEKAWVASILRDEESEKEIATYAGGSCFAIVEMGTSLKDALDRANKLRAKIQRNTPEDESGTKLPRLAIAAGVVRAPGKFKTGDEMLEIAINTAKYAKKQGLARAAIYGLDYPPKER